MKKLAFLLVQAIVFFQLLSCATSKEKFGAISQQSNWPTLIAWLKPYQPPLSQGVFVTKEAVKKLRAGMTQEQVAFILGTPLLVDPYHKNRWEYPFRYDNGKGLVTQSNLVVYFDTKERISSLEGGSLPGEIEFIKLLNING